MKKTMSRREFLRIAIGGSALAGAGMVAQLLSGKARIITVPGASDKIKHDLPLVVKEGTTPILTVTTITSSTSITPPPNNRIVHVWETAGNQVSFWGRDGKTEEMIYAGLHIGSWNCSFPPQQTGLDYFLSCKNKLLYAYIVEV